MIDPLIAIAILAVAALLGGVMHLLIPYLGKATLVAWVLLEIGLWGWFLAKGGTIFSYTTIATAAPAALLILLIGLPFEYRRRRDIRARGREVLKSGGFACPHCGCIYDRELEDDRCPDCGGAVDGAPGVLG